MADLTNLESKLAEVLGLAAAAKSATEKVKGMLGEDQRDLAGVLEQMGDEAAETEQRCTEVAGTFDGKKTAIIDAGRETRQEAEEMMKTTPELRARELAVARRPRRPERDRRLATRIYPAGR